MYIGRQWDINKVGLGWTILLLHTELSPLVIDFICQVCFEGALRAPICTSPF